MVVSPLIRLRQFKHTNGRRSSLPSKMALLGTGRKNMFQMMAGKRAGEDAAEVLIVGYVIIRNVRLLYYNCTILL